MRPKRKQWKVERVRVTALRASLDGVPVCATRKWQCKNLYQTSYGDSRCSFQNDKSILDGRAHYNCPLWQDGVEVVG